MPEISARLIRRIEQDFPDEGSAAEVVRLVDKADESERVQAAIVLWSRGDLHRLRDALDLAKHDWRDVLVRAELADDDWPIKLDEALGGEG
ncbi:MAG TPA: hypothetical protein VE441_18090 [Mycobacterium sp.]|nr:hypothetical protein [Mycobacterium sp.]